MKYYVVLFLLLFTLDLPASNSYNSNIVNQFIDEMYEKHDYKKDNLKELFNQIKEEKKLKKFLKKPLKEDSHGMVVSRKKNNALTIKNYL